MRGETRVVEERSEYVRRNTSKWGYKQVDKKRSKGS